MKLFKWHLSIVAAIMLFTGCTTTDSTGEKVFDPDKTAAVQEAIKPAIATGVLMGIKAEEKTAPAFMLADQVLGGLLKNGVIEPVKVMEALQLIEIPGLADNPDARLAVQVAINTTLGLYQVAIAQSVQEAVSRDMYLLSALQTLKGGISMGLEQAKVAGLID